MAQPAVPAEDTLAALLQAEAVPMAVLHERYSSLLELVRRVIGVVPNCNPYLEVWPPAFRTYNVMVPNLLNLPFIVWGFGAPRSTLGLAMYVSSRAAGCMYCSAHSCTFALRRAPPSMRWPPPWTVRKAWRGPTGPRCLWRALCRSYPPPSTMRIVPSCGATSPRPSRSGSSSPSP